MKKLMNDPFAIVTESIDGFVLANRGKVHRVEDLNVVVKNTMPPEKKAAILIGGGSGHEPLFLEFIGQGMADCAVAGNIFASPSVDMVYEGIKAANCGEGVLMIYGNYQGDIINFEMAQDMARMEDIRVETVRVWDDVASAAPDNKEERRGTSGDLLVIKVAGAASDKGLSFDEVLRITEKARDNCRSIGVSLSSCSLPATGKPIFELGEDEMYLGMGVHGEPGIRKIPFTTADETAKIMADQIFADDLDLSAGSEIVMVVNGYGSTTSLELNVMTRAFHKLMEERGIQVYGTITGSLCTSLEMSGVSLTVMKLDEELKAMYDAPAVSPGFSKAD